MKDTFIFWQEMKRENEGVEEQLSTKVNHYVVMYMCHQPKDHDKTFPTMMWKVAFDMEWRLTCGSKGADITHVNCFWF
jgi:hypothetical protein